MITQSTRVRSTTYPDSSLRTTLVLQLTEMIDINNDETETGDLYEPQAAVRERQGPRAGTSPGQRAVPPQGAAGEAEPEGRGAHEPPARPVRRARYPTGVCVVPTYLVCRSM